MGRVMRLLAASGETKPAAGCCEPDGKLHRWESTSDLKPHRPPGPSSFRIVREIIAVTTCYCHSHSALTTQFMRHHLPLSACSGKYLIGPRGATVWVLQLPNNEVLPSPAGPRGRRRGKRRLTGGPGRAYAISLKISPPAASLRPQAA